MFSDTEHPVCLALFTKTSQNTQIYEGDKYLGLLSEIEAKTPNNAFEFDMKFNDKNGKLGLLAIDNTLEPSIRFCKGSEIDSNKIETLVNLGNVASIEQDFYKALDFYKKALKIDKENLIIFQPNKLNWKQKLSEIISKVSNKEFLIIIDSFNGIYNLFDDLESARFVNSCIMLLSSLGKQSNSTIVITGMARKKENSEWILSPGGKNIMKLARSSVYFLKKTQNDLKLKKIDQLAENRTI